MVDNSALFSVPICSAEPTLTRLAETAGLFRMLGRLMDAKSDAPEKPDIKLLTRFMSLLGRLFQIRDDYMNLTSADVSSFEVVVRVTTDLKPSSVHRAKGVLRGPRRGQILPSGHPCFGAVRG
jgi:hypothetical protein